MFNRELCRVLSGKLWRVFSVKGVNTAYSDASHEADFEVCEMFAMKLISMRYEANSLFVYKVN